MRTKMEMNPSDFVGLMVAFKAINNSPRTVLNAEAWLQAYTANRQ